MNIRLSQVKSVEKQKLGQTVPGNVYEFTAAVLGKPATLGLSDLPESSWTVVTACFDSDFTYIGVIPSEDVTDKLADDAANLRIDFPSPDCTDSKPAIYPDQ